MANYVTRVPLLHALVGGAVLQIQDVSLHTNVRHYKALPEESSYTPIFTPNVPWCRRCAPERILAMPLCRKCNLFDLRSFRQDPYGQCGYATAWVREQAASCRFCALLNNSLDLDCSATWIHFEIHPPGMKINDLDQDGQGLGL